MCHRYSLASIELRTVATILMGFVSQAYNLCYSTLVAGEDKNKLDPDQYLTSPSGDVFVKSEVRCRGYIFSGRSSDAATVHSSLRARVVYMVGDV